VWKAYVVVAIAAGLGAFAAGLNLAGSLAVAILVPALPAFLIGMLRGAGTPGAREDPAVA
jgi:hypothetical protein